MRLDSDKIEEILYRENLKVAPFSKRALAYLIDDLLIALIFFIMFFSQFSSVRGNELALTQLVGSLSIYAVILRFFYQSIFTYLYSVRYDGTISYGHKVELIYLLIIGAGGVLAYA